MDKYEGHTPGPWVAIRQRGRYEGNYCIRRKGETGLLNSFVTVRGPNDLRGNHLKDAEANARLIAAAPRLAARVDEEAERMPDHDDQAVIHESPLLAYLHPGRFAAIKKSLSFPFPAGMKK